MSDDKRKEGRTGLSRRDFLKVTAAGAAAAGAGVGLMPAPASAITPVAPDTLIKTFHTTCPYCSASCGQVVSVGDVTGSVYDIWGDADSPINNGGLCAKGAGAQQLVTNIRRLGVCGLPTDPNFAGKSNPVNATFNYDAAMTDGVAYMRTANGPWGKVALTTAMNDIATALNTARVAAPVPGLTAASNRKSVQFFGCSHMNNEANHLYRKIIANFGTSNVEHQARI